MEFMNRTNRPTPAVTTSPTTPEPPAGSGRGKKLTLSKGLRAASVVLFVSATILLLAVAAQMIYNRPKSEAAFVNPDKIQAVFLNGGQVYFGRISHINKDYLRLVDIFYLQVNQQIQPEQENAPAPDNISLVKLGCELHRPTDEMIINRAQVLFWENLKNDPALNTVPGAIKEYERQFPQGQECPEEAAQQQNVNAPVPGQPNAPAVGQPPQQQAPAPGQPRR